MRDRWADDIFEDYERQLKEQLTHETTQQETRKQGTLRKEVPQQHKEDKSSE